MSSNSITNTHDVSLGTPAGRVILFGIIPTTIPNTTPTVTPPTTHVDTTLTPNEIPIVSPIILSSLDYTPASPDYSPTSDKESDPSEDPSPDRIPPLPATSPFLSSTDDSLGSDTLDTPPSPTHGTPFTEITLSTQRSPVASGALHHRTSSDSSLDEIYDSSSGHSSSDHSSPALPSGRRSSQQLCYQYRVFLIHLLLLSRDHLILLLWVLLARGRIRSSDFVTDLKDCSDESFESSVTKDTSLRDDVIVRGSDEPYQEPDIDLEIQAKIDECITYADALRVEGIEARVVVETIA
nr:hypothetical protein [Tanacetum cinerariifolium]